MFTLCPKCALTLIVTAADLRAGQGYVRCGRCSNVFNALVSLSDERETVAGPSALPGSGSASESTEASTASGVESTPAPSPSVSSPVAEAASDPDARDASESREAEQEIPDRALEFNPAASDVSQVFVEAEHGVAQAIGTGTFKMLVLRNKDLARTLGLDDDEEETGETLEASGEHEQVPDALRKEVNAATQSSASTLAWLQGRKAEPVVAPRVRHLWTAGAVRARARSDGPDRESLPRLSRLDPGVGARVERPLRRARCRAASRLGSRCL